MAFVVNTLVIHVAILTSSDLKAVPEILSGHCLSDAYLGKSLV